MIQSNMNRSLETHIYRQKDDQGNLLKPLIYKDVFVPFKISVPAGYSTFEVPIPITYSNHLFSFDNLMLIPDYYELQAQLFDEETEEDLDELLTYSYQVKLMFNLTKPFYGPTYQPQVETKLTRLLMRNINTYFEFNKPDALVHTGFFFDWYDLRFNRVKNQTFDQYVQTMALTFYNEPYDQSKHFNALPISARTIRGANNYLLPKEWTVENLANIRLRMNIAPNTTSIFSTNKHLNCMGFSDQQIGERSPRKQFTIENIRNSGFLSILADDPFVTPLTDLAKNFKQTVNIKNPNYESSVMTIQISKREAEKNENYQTAIQTSFNALKENCNFKFDLTYNNAKRNFTFHFPENEFIYKMMIVLPPNLLVALGFPMFKDITPLNNEGQKLDIPDTSNLEEKARALVHETGLVIVSDLNTTTNTNYGIGEQYMAALYPTETGSMVMHVNELCHEQPVMRLNARGMSTQTIPATFLLSKFLDQNNLVKLIWKEGFKMQGTLRGVHPEKFEKV